MKMLVEDFYLLWARKRVILASYAGQIRVFRGMPCRGMPPRGELAGVAEAHDFLEDSLVLGTSHAGVMRGRPAGGKPQGGLGCHDSLEEPDEPADARRKVSCLNPLLSAMAEVGEHVERLSAVPLEHLRYGVLYRRRPSGSRKLARNRDHDSLVAEGVMVRRVGHGFPLEFSAVVLPLGVLVHIQD